MPNTYDVKTEKERYIAVSKFFDCPVGTGSTDEEAILSLEKHIKYLSVNKPQAYKQGLLKQIQALRDSGEIPLSIYKG